MRTESTVERRTFTFKRCLGRGGFGEVYLATMTSSGGVTTDVAVKVLLTDVDMRSQAVQRLRDEGKLLGALNHPAILRVHDIVLLEGRVALVTEYVDGADLSRIFQSRDELPVRTLVEIVGRVADALHAAWMSPSPKGGELNLVHRDIKPQNIRIGRHGDVKVLDFGIARASNENVGREAQTATNVVVGSFGYISPERMFSSGAIVPAGDVFALGCVLYQGLVREPFFHRVEEKRMYALALDNNEYDSFLAKRMDKAKSHGKVSGLLLGMLQFDPDNRPTAHEVATTCEHLAEEMQGQALKRWSRERKWPADEPVAGALDGKMITEATLARTGGASVAPPPPQDATPEPAPSVSGSRSGGMSQASGSSARTGLIVAGGGLAAVASLGGALALLLIVVVGIWLVLASPAPPPPPEEAPTPVAKDTPKPVKMPVIDAPVKAKEPEKDVVVAPKTPVKTDTKSTKTNTNTNTSTSTSTSTPPSTTASTSTPPSPPPKASKSGTVLVEGGVRVELWSGANKINAGSVPAGRYDVRVDFGNGLLQPIDPIEVKGGQTQVIKCSKLRQTCTTEIR